MIRTYSNTWKNIYLKKVLWFDFERWDTFFKSVSNSINRSKVYKTSTVSTQIERRCSNFRPGIFDAVVFKDQICPLESSICPKKWTFGQKNVKCRSICINTVSTMKIVCIEFEGQPRVLENLGHLPNAY